MNLIKRILVILILCYSTHINAQSSDSIETYISFAPCITNELGNFKTKFSPTLEIGRQYYDVFTLGLAVGKTNMLGKTFDDAYLEFRPNLNVFQVGRFTNTITPGIGYVFGPNPALLIEWTSGVEYAYTSKIHFNVFFGNYYYSGFDTNATQHFSPTFFGFSIVKFFKPVKNKGIFNLK